MGKILWNYTKSQKSTFLFTMIVKQLWKFSFKALLKKNKMSLFHRIPTGFVWIIAIWHLYHWHIIIQKEEFFFSKKEPFSNMKAAQNQIEPGSDIFDCCWQIFWQWSSALLVTIKLARSLTNLYICINLHNITKPIAVMTKWWNICHNMFKDTETLKMAAERLLKVTWDSSWGIILCSTI